MNIINYDAFNATNYFTVFECNVDEKKKLLGYLSWLIESDVKTKILNDKKFSPSGEWIKWLSGNYLAFSEDKIMFKSGHKLYCSYNPIFIPAYYNITFTKFLKLVYSNFQRWFSIDCKSPDKNESVFRKFYPDFRNGNKHEDFMRIHPGPYFRVLEPNVLLGDDVKRDVLLEIGAGAGINPIFNFINYSSKSIIVDLPETISMAFALIKTFIPSARIALPNHIDKEIKAGTSFNSIVASHDFIFILPIQVDLMGNDFVDVAFNMASFQEMDISVVRNYVALIHKVLKPEGHVAILNLETSRQIPGNSMDKYGLNCFTKGDFIDAKFANWQINKMRNLKYICYLGSK